MVVTGCAGSGKTMLAVEQAKRLAAKGERVLFVCFNRALRDHLQAKREKKGVDFYTFHALCRRLARHGGRRADRLPSGEAPQTFWDEEMPLALMEAIEELGPQYDALFVDEAQDTRDLWLEALMTTLEDPDEAHVWLFMDDNQRVYEQQLDVPGEFHPFDLTVNCRNTQAIHREVIKKYAGEVIPEATGPEGRAVELYNTKDQPDRHADHREGLQQRGGAPAGHRRPFGPRVRRFRGHSERAASTSSSRSRSLSGTTSAPAQFVASRVSSRPS